MQNGTVEATLVAHQKGINTLVNKAAQNWEQMLCQSSWSIPMSKETTYHINHQALVAKHFHLHLNQYTYIINFTVAQNISQVLLREYSIFYQGKV